jgi:peptidoglycan-associated lipoprotein
MRPLTLSLVVLCAILAGCGSEEAQEPAAASTAGGEGNSKAAERNVSLTPENPTEGAEPCALGTVHFEFDSSDLDEASKAAITAAVECYQKNGAPAQLHLTGATDPRGTEEYNIALGERRALSVRKYMEALGVGSERISVSSVGEEMASGTDESGWAQDRAVTSEEAGAE